MGRINWHIIQGHGNRDFFFLRISLHEKGKLTKTRISHHQLCTMATWKLALRWWSCSNLYSLFFTLLPMNVLLWILHLVVCMIDIKMAICQILNTRTWEDVWEVVGSARATTCIIFYKPFVYKIMSLTASSEYWTSWIVALASIVLHILHLIVTLWSTSFWMDFMVFEDFRPHSPKLHQSCIRQ